MKNQNGSSRVDTVLKMMLIAFVSLLAFSSGVWFGKSLSDSDHKLKALESDFSSASHTAQMDSKREEGQEDPLAEEEVASISEKFVTDQRDELNGENKSETKTEAKADVKTEKTNVAAVAPATKEASKKEARTVASEPTTSGKAAATSKNHTHDSADSNHSTATAKNETTQSLKPDLSAAHEAAERVARNIEPSETTKPTARPAEHSAVTVATNSATPNAKDAKNAKPTRSERAPSSAGLPKTVGTAGEVEFTVQIAAFPTADLAKSRADELVKKGFPAFPVEATVNGRTWFRVSVGSFKTMKEAAGYRVQLLKQAELSEAIVQRIQR